MKACAAVQELEKMRVAFRERDTLLDQRNSKGSAWMFGVCLVRIDRWVDRLVA